MQNIIDIITKLLTRIPNSENINHHFYLHGWYLSSSPLNSKAIDNPKKDIIDSYGKSETSSGLRKATLIDFASGKSNPSGTTIAAILDTLEMSLSEFGAYYDKINMKEIF